MVSLPAPACSRTQEPLDDRSEFLTEMERMKKLCENYERKLDEAEHKAALWEEKAKQVRDEALKLHEEAEISRSQAHDSHSQAERWAKESAKSKKARAIAEEKNRRLEEILEETRKIEELVSKANKGLVLKLAQQEKWMECMDDDEVRRTMGQLYQELEDWIKRHFPCLLPPTTEETLEADERNSSFQIYPLHEIQAEVYGLISSSILRRAFVGILDESRECLFRELDQEVSSQCPDHIWHQWRSATSNALCSLASPDLRYYCDELVGIIEARFEAHSGTDAAMRTQEMKLLLWSFVEFKNKLNRQKERYTFWWLVPGMPFNEVHMSSVTGENPPHGGIVQLSLSPILSKSSRLQDGHTVVLKAKVKLTTMAAQDEDAVSGKISKRYEDLEYSQ